MTTTLTKRAAELVHAERGKCLTDSLRVAEKFGKRHGNVIRAIEKLDCPEDFRRLNFESSSYQNQQGKEQPKYVITRDGFTILAMGFTGREAMRWKLALLADLQRRDALLLARGLPYTERKASLQAFLGERRPMLGVAA